MGNKKDISPLKPYRLNMAKDGSAPKSKRQKEDASNMPEKSKVAIKRSDAEAIKKEKNKSKADFSDKQVLELAKELLKKDICDNCFGRQFGQIGHGFTNKERAEKIKALLKSKKTAAKKYCEVCDNIFRDLDEIAETAMDKLRQLDFRTFAVGTKLSSEIIYREETLWEDFGIEYCEPIRSELNRELGKLILKKIEKIKKGVEPDENKPEVIVLFDVESRNTKVTPNPLFVYGKYKKLVRGLPQTKWETYKETVEDIIAKPFMKITKGVEHAFHGCGREDIDARCLDWRPFVFEVSKPKNRTVDLKKMEKEVNKSGKVEISELRLSDKNEVRELKAATPDKTYRLIAIFEKPVTEKELEKLKQLKGLTINQQTPNRVLHRRADLLRKRKVKDISWKILGENKVEFIITGAAGLYVKELVHGDSGRTMPSISDMLKNPAKVEELDVIKIWVE